MSTPTKIKALEQQRQTLIQKLLDIQPMIRGSFGTAHRKCGKPNCWCVDGAGHPVMRITWTEDARARTKAIPVEDADWAEAMTSNYKRFRKNRQALRALERKINAALDELETKTVEKTKPKKEYLK